ncbi:hypothetical protein Tco_0109764 [Tanacetum coccineum]
MVLAMEDNSVFKTNAIKHAVLISNSESYHSLECLFGDENDDPDDECCDVMDAKKASLLMMNFTIKELQDHKGVTKTIYTGEGYVERANLGVVITMIMRSSSFYIEQGCQVSAKHL